MKAPMARCWKFRNPSEPADAGAGILGAVSAPECWVPEFPTAGAVWAGSGGGRRAGGSRALHVRSQFRQSRFSRWAAAQIPRRQSQSAGVVNALGRCAARTAWTASKLQRKRPRCREFRNPSRRGGCWCRSSAAGSAAVCWVPEFPTAGLSAAGTATWVPAGRLHLAQLRRLTRRRHCAGDG